MKILYFTATGNNLYVAKSLGGELLSIPQMLKENTFEFEDDKIGIVFPIYSNKVLPYVENFIRKSTFRCDYLFGIMSYGAYAGASSKHLMQIGEESGNRFAYINTIKMVDNWLPGFNMEKQQQSEHKKKIEEKLSSIQQDIAQSKQWIRSTNALDNVVTNHWIQVEKKNPKKDSLHGISSGLGIKNFITVEPTCIECGTCAKVCPVDNIKVVGGTDKIKLGEFCLTCFACTQNCPVNAIRLKGERSRARFRNRHVTVQEIIAANH